MQKYKVYFKERKMDPISFSIECIGSRFQVKKQVKVREKTHQFNPQQNLETLLIMIKLKLEKELGKVDIKNID